MIVFFIHVALKPSEFPIERTQRIQASCTALYPFINDLREFNRWNPFAQGDPTLKLDYVGPVAGTGAVYMGGLQQIRRWPHGDHGLQPPSRVAVKLDFSKPYEAQNLVEFASCPMARRPP